MEGSIVAYNKPQTPNFVLHLLPYALLHPQIKLISIHHLKRKKKPKNQKYKTLTHNN